MSIPVARAPVHPSPGVEATPTPASTSAFPSVAPTSEDTWRALVAGLAPLALPWVERVVVVSPHPDDEALACGGLMAELARRGTDVQVVAVTDGEGSHPGAPGLAAIRRSEQAKALACLGVAAPPVRLGLADGAVGDDVPALARDLERHLAGADLLVAPWAGDGHADHDACGAAAVEAARATATPLWAYPVWAWQWARPADVAPLGLRRVHLGPDARAAKASALACYPSQTTDALGPTMLDDGFLTRFRRPFEVFSRAA